MIVTSPQVKEEKVSRAMDICILLDLSGSMAFNAVNLEEQLVKFVVTGSDVEPNDMVQIVGFDQKHLELLKPSKKSKITEKAILDFGIRNLKNFGGGTQLWISIEWCVDNRKRFIDEKK
jgi:hypothetical protein